MPKYRNTITGRYATAQAAAADPAHHVTESDARVEELKSEIEELRAKLDRQEASE